MIWLSLEIAKKNRIRKKKNRSDPHKPALPLPFPRLTSINF